MFVNFCCSHSRRLLIKSSLIRSFQTSTQSLQRGRTHYEILGLKNDCTEKEIRNAFVSKSKEKHPDVNFDANKNSDPKSNQEFIQVMEAYQVLSKVHSRANYDLSLKGIDTVNYIRRDTVYEPWKVDPSQYSERGPNYSPYYGVKGMKKLSNWKIVIACIVFTLFGVSLQAIAIMRSMTLKRELLIKSSAISEERHQQVREEAERYGNAEQIERLKQRLKESSFEVYDKK